ncbi:MAG: transposase, partial [Desulfobulbaceae bacterium]|nr:transposase [Desulfobulbaceae bacterium]
MKLGADPKYTGGSIEFLAVLHTWSGALIFYPHVHCLVPGGGFHKGEQTWNRSRAKYLVPVKTLSPVFRAKFLDMAAKALPYISLPSSTRQMKWVVYSKPAAQSPEEVVEYLGRYVFRSAITNASIL